MTLRLADAEPSPDVFAAVMATGIVSIAAEKHQYRLISETMGVLASPGLVFLIALVILTRRFRVWDLRDPDITLRLFTFFAACAVLGRRSLSTVSLVFCWIAVTAWVIVAIAGLLRLRRAVVSNRD